MQLFSSNNPKEKQHSGVLGAFAVDVIKWEPETANEASLISHKFEYEDFPNGSSLIVAPSQMAVFTNNLAAGDSLDADGSGQSQVSVFSGPCKITLETGDSRFSPFRNISHALTGGDSAFHSTVFFINTTYMNELSWGTQDPIMVQDPEEEINVHVRAHGMYGVHIEKTDTSIAEVQARKFLQKVVGTRSDYTEKELRDFMRARILEYVPNLLANRIIEEKIGVLKVNAHLSEFSEIIFEKLADHFFEFGLSLDNFSFHSINVPDEDLAVITEAKNKRRRAQIEAEGSAAAMDIESAARARMRERESFTYQQEQSFGVMQAAAENEGTSSTFMGAGLGLGMGFGMGGAVGAGMQTIAQQTIGEQNAQSAVKMSASSNQVKCPGCEALNPPDAKFCLNCGEKFASGGISCPDCGTQMPADAKFCLNCGKKLIFVCPACGKNLISDAKFCPECGGKL